ncbi:MAG: FAD-dependent oxidoreductase [Candidatus Humimicrobiaceae bacterium]
MEQKKYLTESKAAYTPLNAIEEASRCLLCYEAPCSKACPAGTNPEKFIRSIRFRNIKGAVETIREANILGASCARVCPVDKLCECACSRTSIDRPIDIGGLQRYVMDFEQHLGLKVLEAPTAVLEKVAIVGAGPAGLSAASYLALRGYKVTIFEEKEKAGGMLTYGIVPSRLPQDIVDYEVSLVKELGVAFQFNMKIGRDLSLEQLKNNGFRAICIATGLQDSIPLKIPGLNLEGVTTAAQFLGIAKPTKGEMEVPDNVIIVGGGDVAMDCAITAKDLGAKNVIVIYRRTISEMPAGKAEIEHVRNLGISIIPNFALTKILREGGKIKGIKAVGLHWKDRNTSTEEDCSLSLKAEMVIQAIGQKPEDISFIGVRVSSKGLIVSDPSDGKTSVEEIYAIGDIINGGKTVVEAVAHGKAAACAINVYLSSKRKLKEAGGRATIGKESVS